MIILATSVWVLLVAPTNPGGQEREFYGINWPTLKACDDFTRQPGNIRALWETIYQWNHPGKRPHQAPAIESVTTTCVERVTP